MTRRTFYPLLALVLFVGVGVLCELTLGGQVNKGNPNVIRIVSSLPRNGSARGQTDSIVQGLRLAFHEIGNQIELTDPDTGETKTYTIEYLDLDDSTAAAGNWTPEQEIANAFQATTDPDVMAYVGTYNSGAAKVSMPILNKAGVLMVSPANTSTSLTKPGWGDRHEPMCYQPSGNINYVRVVPADDVQGAVAAQWAFELECKQVYVLDDTEMYGNGIAKLFKKTCEEKFGIKVLGHESIDPKAQEFKPLLQKIKGLKPDLIYFGGTSQTKAGQVFKDMISTGLTCPMMGPDGTMERAMIDSAGWESFEVAPFYATFGGLPIKELTEGRGPEFVKNFTKYYDKAPTEAYAAYGYECGLVVIDAMKRAGKKDRDAIRRAGISTKNFAGTIGTWSFDENGDTDSKLLSVNKVGRTTDPETGEEIYDFLFVKRIELK